MQQNTRHALIAILSNIGMKRRPRKRLTTSAAGMGIFVAALLLCIVALPNHALAAPRTAAQFSSTYAIASTNVVKAPGFDACNAPSPSQLNSWWSTSPYTWLNIYIGGENRACSNTNLTSSWVSQVYAQGWNFVPTWVGLQAPCTSPGAFYVMSGSTSTAFQQGASDADSATSALENIGIGPGTIIYFDMEYYDQTNGSCTAAVNSFINGWSQELHTRGFSAGVYESALDTNSVATASITKPDDIWIAGGAYWGSSYSNSCSVWNNADLSNSYWPNDQRLYQYTGGHNETYNGVTLNIDSDCADSSMVGHGEDPAAINTQDVYSLGQNGHLLVAHWRDGSGWTQSDVTSLAGGPAGVSLSGTPSGHSFLISGSLYQDAYVTGSNGHLYEYWWNNGAWHLNDLNVAAAPPAGVTFVGAPSGYSFTLPGQIPVHHAVYVVGSDSHLYSYAWAQGSPWTLADLTSLAGGPAGVALTAAPSAHYFLLNGGAAHDVYLIGSNGHLYEYWWSNGAWHLNDLSATVPLPTGVSATGAASGYSFTSPGQSATHHNVFVVGSDNHLYNYAWQQGNPWALADVTQAVGGAPAGVSLNGTPNTHAFLVSGSLYHDVYLSGGNGHLYEYWWSNGAWHLNDLSAIAPLPAGVTVIGSASGYSYLQLGHPAGQLHHSVYTVDSDGHLREFIWVQGSPWTVYDHGAPSSGTLFTGSPNGHAYSS